MQRTRKEQSFLLSSGYPHPCYSSLLARLPSPLFPPSALTRSSETPGASFSLFMQITTKASSFLYGLYSSAADLQLKFVRPVKRKRFQILTHSAVFVSQVPYRKRALALVHLAFCMSSLPTPSKPQEMFSENSDEESAKNNFEHLVGNFRKI